MQQQSVAYNPFPTVRNVDFSVRFELVDTEAKGNAVPSASQEARCSQITQTINANYEMSDKWATLENDFWALDGTFDIMPDSVSELETGWWSEAISNEAGSFETAPYIMFSFGNTSVSTIGWTLTFDTKAKGFPTQIKATAYGSDGATIIKEQTFNTYGEVQVLNANVSGYYSVRFDFLKTDKPYRRIKLCEADFGAVQIFDKDSLESVQIKYGASIASENIPSRELSFAFDNSDKKYNLLNPDGIYAFLQEGQNISAQCYIDGESVKMGDFNFTNATAKDGTLTAEIVANDIIYALDGAYYNSGSNTTKTLSGAVSDILNGYNITTEIDSSVSANNVVMAVPKNTTIREALRLVAQAAMCSVWVDRYGALKFSKIQVGTSVDNITENELYDYNGVFVSEKVDGVSVNVNNEYNDTQVSYSAGSGKNIKTIDNPCVYSGLGNNVANWLLLCYNRRKNYSVKNRCNPACEISDTITISDAYGQNGDATITEIEINFNGGLNAITKATGM